MRADTRKAITKALDEIEAHKTAETPLCACRRPVPTVLPAAVQKAVDDIRAALEAEPDSGIGGYIELG